MVTAEISTVSWSERHQRFEFEVRAGSEAQRFGHYACEDAERHRQQLAERLRARGYRVEAPSDS